MPFNVTFSPSDAATAGTRKRTFCFVDETATMVVYAHPDCLTIEPPEDPVLWPGYVRFLRELRNAADELITWVERGPVPSVAEQGE
ncbi:hypothetical protein B1813_09625 [Saccharomonospora piscinae]|uniref:Uncharacterized protein n=1 Tax=Saccharomonospora piscinae TaxID=687388 RepID=A0A1V9A5P2_SACPI|nr:hypothetical protein [Saccharomonospora piscinae]OQO92449.1 hypothetical protein B1813_09625 [Saccharomonospora piscinae]